MRMLPGRDLQLFFQPAFPASRTRRCTSSLSLVKPPQQQQQHKTRPQTLDRMDGSASIDGEFVEVNVRRAAQSFECAAATGIGEGREDGDDVLLAYLRGVGVCDIATMAGVIRGQDLLPAHLPGLDADDIVELLAACRKAGVTVGDRSKLKIAMRRQGNTQVPVTPRPSPAAAMPTHHPGSSFRYHGRTPSSPRDAAEYPEPEAAAAAVAGGAVESAAQQPQHTPVQPAPEPAPAPQPSQQREPPQPQPQSQWEQQQPRSPQQNFSASHGPQLQGMMASLLMFVGPLRDGVADFIDSIADKYVRPFISSQLAAAQGLSDGQSNAPARNWLQGSLPRVVLAFAVLRSITSIFTRVDSMMAFLLGFFLRKRGAKPILQKGPAEDTGPPV
jgi:hypothetical protein